MAGFTAELWGLEEYKQAILPLEAIMRWGEQKGAKYENTYGSGRSQEVCAFYCYQRHSADCSQAKYLLADRGYYTNEIMETAQNAGMKVIIPQKKSRKVLREYDKNVYKLRYIIENTLLKLKQWRGIATSSLYCFVY